MQEEQIREPLKKHWDASAAGDADAEHDIYDDDAICDYPQSGERILGRSNLQASRRVSRLSEFSEGVISGSRNTPSSTRGGQHTQ
jgi:hypothetical protein